jgi:autotransporter-associated beta strand protein
LEDRLIPATHTWTGNVNALWSVAGNWSGGTPQGDPNPDLIFPAAALNKTNTDNFAAALPIHSIQFAGAGYTLNSSGSPLNLLAGGSLSGIAAGTDAVVINLNLVAPASYAVVTFPGVSLVLSGTVSGVGGLAKTGPGDLALSQPNTYQGSTAVVAGSVHLNVINAIPAISNVTVATGSSLILNSHDDRIASLADGPGGGGTVDLGATRLLTGNGGASTLFSGKLTGANGVLIKEGAGGFTLTGPNSYTGATFITGGTLSAGNNFVIPVTQQGVVLSGSAVFNLSGYTEEVGNLSGPAGTQVIMRSATLLTGSNGPNTTYAGVVTGPNGNLIKEGINTLTLTGANTYTGLTTVRQGTLLVNGSITSNVQVAPPGVATLGGSGVVGTITANNPGVVAPGDPGTAGTLHGNATTFQPGSRFVAKLLSTASFDRLQVNGSVTIVPGSNLVMAPSFNPPIGSTFTIIQATVPVAGTFAGPNPFVVNGLRFKVFYNAVPNTVIVRRIADSASQLSLNGPATASANQSFPLTVSALDSSGNVDTEYTGTVHFTSPDPTAALPSDYTFTAADAGMHTFQVMLRTAGTQSITATDRGTPPLTGSARVTITPILFSSPIVYPVGAMPIAIATADFNGDGIADVVTINPGDATIQVLLGNGDGTFGAVHPEPKRGGCLFVTTADVNGDGIPDLIESFAGSTQLAIQLGNGDGTFQDPLFVDAYPGGSGPITMVKPVFQNGVVSLVAVDPTANSISVLMGNGDGTFQDPMIYPVGQNPTALDADDFRGAGLLDLVVTNSGDNTLSILLGNPDGTFQPAMTYRTVPPGPGSVTVADVNGDGIPDLLVTYASPTGGPARLGVWLGQGDGTFADDGDIPICGTPPRPWPWPIVVGDFNGDGRLDFAVTDFNAGGVWVGLSNGDGTFAVNGINFPAGAGPVGLVAGDFNGDGLLDLAVTNSRDNTVSILLGLGASSPGSPGGSGGLAGTRHALPGHQSAPLALGYDLTAVAETWDAALPRPTQLIPTEGAAASLPAQRDQCFAAVVPAQTPGPIRVRSRSRSAEVLAPIDTINALFEEGVGNMLGEAVLD